jgi:hypothetical protein
MDINRALTLAAKANQADLGRTYAAAVAQGANNTRCTPAQERDYGTLRLLTLALLRLPDLALCGYMLDIVDEPEEDPSLARASSEVAAGALRLAHRALEVHGRDVGYCTDAWLERMTLLAGFELSAQASSDEHEVPVALDHVRSAAVALSRAAAATANDRMQVPEQVAEGLGHLLAVYALARTAGG